MNGESLFCLANFEWLCMLFIIPGASHTIHPPPTHDGRCRLLIKCNPYCPCFTYIPDKRDKMTHHSGVFSGSRQSVMTHTPSRCSLLSPLCKQVLDRALGHTSCQHTSCQLFPWLEIALWHTSCPRSCCWVPVCAHVLTALTTNTSFCSAILLARRTSCEPNTHSSTLTL